MNIKAETIPGLGDEKNFAARQEQDGEGKREVKTK